MPKANKNLCRDATTPEEQTKQILNIAAILPGQKPDSKFRIPTRRESQLSRHDSQPQTHVHQASASAKVEPQPTGDLIDFGDEPAQLQKPQPEQARKASSAVNPTVIGAGTAAPALTQDPPGFERSQLLKDMTNDRYDPGLEHHQTSTTTAAKGAGADLLELQDGVSNLHVASDGKNGLSSASGVGGRHALRRKDSETNEDDEFVDAES